MRLKSLRLHGFKSFADRTSLDFRDGVTAVIGSNGCGKSNIADSIRWVLGEQRASAIRGAKMEEVIFQGTTRRRPLNLAEVSLLFENDRGRVAIPQSEIEVTRKVYREGGSEYSLNRASCRLRDIQGLLRDTGLGSNAYAIIEAGMIETLLSDRAEERRMLFEEAAGIGRYKDSRQSAMRRLDAADGDLARLQDLVAEVESKVRSLARQKRKAERHRELQTRRLDLEIAIARTELAALTESLRSAESRRATLDHEERTAAAERAAAETRIEAHRTEAALLTRRRNTVATRLEQVRAQLDAREREMLVADERRGHAELRIEQLVRERQELEQRRVSLAAEIDRSGAERQRKRGALDALRERLEARGDENQAVRSAVLAERAAVEGAAARARNLAREIASAEGERSAAERRRREAEERLAELGIREKQLRSELEQLSAQTELWASQTDEARGRVAAAEDAADMAREEVRALRNREQVARDTARAAEDRLSRLSAQTDAREALERSYEGFAPAVATLMTLRDRFPGVHGPAADFVADSGREPAETEAVEAFLGPLLQAVVVRDLATARELRRWFREEWSGGGSLFLLPLDVPRRAGAPILTGADWVEALLAEVIVVRGDPLAEHVPAVTRVDMRGDVVDARGVVRLVERGSGEGILARREALVRLRAERDLAAAEREARVRERDGIREALEEAEERARETEELRRVLESELKRMEMDGAAHRHRRGRLQQDSESLVATISTLQQNGRRAAEQVAALDSRLTDLARAVELADETDADARARLQELETRWEEARDEESELRVAVARAEAELREVERRLGAAEQGHASAQHRARAIEREARELRTMLEGLSGVRERAGSEIDALFQARDREMGQIDEIDQRLRVVEASLDELGDRARNARRHESQCSEERHRLDLEIVDLRSRIERLRERLEVEWARPWEALLSAAGEVTAGDVDAWREELRETVQATEALGPVNMLAVEEHAEEERRLNFLLEQRDDLTKARDDLVSAIRQINRTAREVFLETFGAVRENFQRVFQSLFLGGECDVWLASPDDPLESPVEIQASPKGKKTQRIHLLSGGERTLTALALLFSLYLVKPSPFCVLDEVDAPLDESNVGRFIQLLQDFKSETQFIVITHNPRTMEAADWVYGVTMEEAGVSTIVGVEMLGAWKQDTHLAVNT